MVKSPSNEGLLLLHALCHYTQSVVYSLHGGRISIYPTPYFMRSRSIRFFAVTALALVLTSCSANENAGGEWVEADKGLVIISPYFDETPEGKYLNVIYENGSQDTIRKLKYELITTEAGKVDTVEREIVLKKRLLPADKHLVTRGQTEKPVNYEAVGVGKVWIVK